VDKEYHSLFRGANWMGCRNRTIYQVNLWQVYRNKYSCTKIFFITVKNYWCELLHVL